MSSDKCSVIRREASVSDETLDRPDSRMAMYCPCEAPARVEVVESALCDDDLSRAEFEMLRICVRGRSSDVESSHRGLIDGALDRPGKVGSLRCVPYVSERESRSGPSA